MKKVWAGALAAIMLTGCGGGDGQPIPAGTATSPVAVPSAASPGPSKSGPMVTPNGTLDPSGQASTNPSTDPLYLEAVRVYKAYFAEMQKVEEEGSPTAALPYQVSQYLTGSMLEAVSGTNLQAHRAGYRLQKSLGQIPMIFSPNPGVAEDGSQVSIRVCTDARTRKMYDRNGNEVGTGALVYREVYFKSVSGHLKGAVVHAKEVTKCPLS